MDLQGLCLSTEITEIHFAKHLNLGDTRTPWRESVNPQVFLGGSVNICNFARVNTFNILRL